MADFFLGDSSVDGGLTLHDSTVAGTVTIPIADSSQVQSWNTSVLSIAVIATAAVLSSQAGNITTEAATSVVQSGTVQTQASNTVIVSANVSPSALMGITAAGDIGTIDAATRSITSLFSIVQSNDHATESSTTVSQAGTISAQAGDISSESAAVIIQSGSVLTNENALAVTELAAFSLTAIAGLSSHFDATTITGVADGGALTTWAGTNGMPAATAVSNPTYLASAINGLAGVQFAANAMDTAVSVDTQSAEIFIVYKATSLARNTLFGASRSADPYREFATGSWAGLNSIQTFIGDGTAYATVSASALPSGEELSPHVLSLSLGAGSQSSNFDGVTGSTTASSLASVSNLRLGSVGYNAPSMIVCEVISYSRPLTSSERNAVSQYLTDKWISGIPSSTIISSQAGDGASESATAIAQAGSVSVCGADTPVSSSAVPIVGGWAATQDGDVTAVATVGLSAALMSYLQASDSSSESANTVIQAGGVSTQDQQIGVTETLARTYSEIVQEPQAGDSVATGSASSSTATTQAVDTASGSCSNVISSASSLSQSGDITSETATAPIQGGTVALQGDDVGATSGFSSRASQSAISQEAQSSITVANSALGGVSLNAIQAGNTSLGSAAVSTIGLSVHTQADDVATESAITIIQSGYVLSQSPNTSGTSSFSTTWASAISLQQPQRASNIANSALGGSALSAAQASDVATESVNVLIQGGSSTSQSANSSEASGTAELLLQSIAQQSDDTSSTLALSSAAISLSLTQFPDVTVEAATVLAQAGMGIIQDSNIGDVTTTISQTAIIDLSQLGNTTVEAAAAPVSATISSPEGSTTSDTSALVSTESSISITESADQSTDHLAAVIQGGSVTAQDAQDGLTKTTLSSGGLASSVTQGSDVASEAADTLIQSGMIVAQSSNNNDMVVSGLFGLSIDSIQDTTTVVVVSTSDATAISDSIQFDDQASEEATTFIQSGLVIQQGHDLGGMSANPLQAASINIESTQYGDISVERAEAIIQSGSVITQDSDSTESLINSGIFIAVGINTFYNITRGIEFDARVRGASYNLSKRRTEWEL